MKTVYPVLMVGGTGSRLWPLSTKDTPKQFQRITSSYSLFQETILRLRGAEKHINFADPIIVGAEMYHDQIIEHLNEINVQPTAIFLEPCPRSTTPVAALVARYLENNDPDAIIALLPSDHHIGKVDIFRQAVSVAAQTAQGGWIMTLGISPTSPETGFGYIQSGEKIGPNANAVAKFTEKPDAATALAYIKDPAYAWNSGIFIFTPDVMLRELETHAPKTLEAVTHALAHANQHETALLLHEEDFAKCDSISIDFAIMEKTDRAAVFSPLGCAWSDVGTWRSVAELQATSSNHDNVISIDNDNCFIKTDSTMFIAALGLTDLIIVGHEGNLLVLPKERSQNVSEIIAALKASNRLDKL